MQQNELVFEQFKIQTLEKLRVAIQNKEVDEEVLPILNAINNHDVYVTTSSCAGRIILMQLPEVGDKKNALFLGRWHRPINSSEVQEALKSYEKGQVWFITQSPIFHIASETIDAADDLVKCGISSGFKHSGFKTGKHRIIVELCSTERMDVPLANNNQCYISDAYLHVLVDCGNDLIQRSQKKLKRLLVNLEKNSRKK